MKVVNNFACNLLFCYLIVIITSVNCRQSIKPQPDIMGLIENSAVLAVDDVQTYLPPCLLDIQKDLPKSNVGQPIYLHPNKEEYWLPNSQGFIEVAFGATIELYCPSRFTNSTKENAPKVSKNTKTIKLSCYHDGTFLWNNSKYKFNQFICSQPPRFLVENTGATCFEEASFLYRVGFNASQGRFIKTMEICHDNKKVQTHYTLHSLVPANFHFQRSIKRLNFSKAGHFKNLDMNFLYSQKNQKIQLEDSHALYFDNKTLFLSRGHLAAKSDQIYANQQRSTFTFFNAAPQWQSFNGGAWAQLEDEVRKFVYRSNIEVDCYTGTWGVLQLSSEQAVAKQQFYLSYDENNNGILPVPKLFYRVILSRVQATHGIVLIGVNNPHATLTEILQEYIICEDIKDDIPWLKWIQNKSLKKGYLYACSVQDFIRVVKHLPKKLHVVNEILV